MLDSLVRVSRRVGRFGFLRRNLTHKTHPLACPPLIQTGLLQPLPHNRQQHRQAPFLCVSPSNSPPHALPRRPYNAPFGTTLVSSSGTAQSPFSSSGSQSALPLARKLICPPLSFTSNPPLIQVLTISRPPLTLFPKCFSSFLHSTCSLSVSCHYLALDDVYHPF